MIHWEDTVLWYARPCSAVGLSSATTLATKSQQTVLSLVSKSESNTRIIDRGPCRLFSVLKRQPWVGSAWPSWGSATSNSSHPVFKTTGSPYPNAHRDRFILLAMSMSLLLLIKPFPAVPRCFPSLGAVHIITPPSQISPSFDDVFFFHPTDAVLPFALYTERRSR